MTAHVIAVCESLPTVPAFLYYERLVYAANHPTVRPLKMNGVLLDVLATWDPVEEPRRSLGASLTALLNRGLGVDAQVHTHDGYEIAGGRLTARGIEVAKLIQEIVYAPVPANTGNPSRDEQRARERSARDVLKLR